MSSIRGGATGAAKPRQLNVNQVFTGKNLAAGKAQSKHGMVSMGKGTAVFRRMPPHITLPSIKAETGQDQNVTLIPPGASGWSKGDPVETQRAAAAGNGAPTDLRPTWAVTPTPEGPTGHPPASSREFPSLGQTAQGKETNAWNRPDSTGGPPTLGRSHSGSQSADEERPLPTRYFDNSATKPASSYRPRFQGSSDARASQPGFLSRNNSDRERGDSLCESIGGKSDSSDRRPRQFSESFEGSISEQPEQEERNGVNRLPKAPEEVKEEEPLRPNGCNGPSPGGVQILKRPPQKTEKELSDDEEQKQLTKLNRPNAVPFVRRTATGERIDEIPEKPERQDRRENRPQVMKRDDHRVVKEQSQAKRAEPVALPEKKADEVVPAPPPTENIWTKRIEERESQEKEQKARLNKSYQQTIEHHFPVVGDTASIKVDKDAARRPVDTDFTRETLRARRVHTSNDVRNIIPRDSEDRRNTYSREECAEREFNNRFDRYTREVNNEAGEYRGNHQRNQRIYGRDRFDYDNGEVEHRRDEHYHSRNEHHHVRGRTVPKVSAVRGRGRGRTTMTQHRTHPTHQILKRPQRVENDEEDEKIETPVEEKKTVPEPKQEATAQTPKETTPVQSEGTQRETKPERETYVPRGRGRGRGRGEYRRQPFAQTRTERAPRSGDEEEPVETRPPRQTKYPTRGIYNPRGRQSRGSKVYVNKNRAGSKHRSSEEPSIEDSRLKSPVVSSEGHEEWETASESSSRIQRPSKEKSPKKEAPKKQDKAQLTAERLRSKNGQPARRTCRSPSGANSNQEENKQELNKTGSDGLAGLDVNNFSKVVMIDNLQDAIVSDGTEESGTFEEVLNKKAKRQKQLEEQLRLEAVKKRELKEKERLDKLQAKKDARKAAIKESKKKASEARKAERQRTNEEKTEGSRGKLLMTTVWNSTHVKEREEKKEELPSHIPSPIARPTPRTKTTPEPVKDERPVVEMPTMPKSSICAEFDFTFDPAIREKPVKESPKKAEEAKAARVPPPAVRTDSVPTAPSESGSVNDDSRLKEKINKVKDLWVENDKEAGALPSNVAKVKPQPQGGEQTASHEDTKEPTSTAAGPSVVQRSPSITPFSTHFLSFPNYLPDMSSSHYAAPSQQNSSMIPPPPNVTSPSNVNMNANYMAPPRHAGARNFIENPMYNPQRLQNMWTSGPHENMMPFNNTPSVPPPHNNSAQFNFNNRQNMPPPPHPSQMQRGPYPPPPPNPNMHHPSHPPAPQQHKMGPSAPPVMFQSVPIDMMSIPPPHPPNGPLHNTNPHLGAVGSQRNDTRPYQSLMTNSYGGPPLQPHHQFNQPPPSLDLRFAQPPPHPPPHPPHHPPPFAPHGNAHDMHWNSNKPFGNQPMGGNFRGNRLPQPPQNVSANDVWSNMNTPILPPYAPHGGQNRMFHGAPKRNDGMKRPTTAGQQPNGTSA